MRVLCMAAVIGLLGSVCEAADAPASPIEYLFVQSAESVSVTAKQITMAGVSPTTIYFSDRPARISGHMKTSHFMTAWTMGDDSFELSNPNAALSVFNGDDVVDLVVVLSHPKLTDGTLTYRIRILDGDIPAKKGAGSLFIDVIGRPRSPLSVAGIARRRTMRHVVTANSRRANEDEEEQIDDARDDAQQAAKDAADSAEQAKQAAPAAAAAPSGHSPEERLGELNKMLKEGFISQGEYDKKKQSILDSL
jgi:hypothetical protein